MIGRYGRDTSRMVGVYLAYGVYQHHSIIPIPTGNPTIPLYPLVPYLPRVVLYT